MTNPIGRRTFCAGLGTGAIALGLTASGPASAASWHGTALAGALPPLAFTMTRASDGKAVTAADYRGKVVLLYFGYTFCPDICPTTLNAMTAVLGKLGKAADQVRVLFVTIDPNRDDLATLKRYTGLFAPQVDGLRGTPDQIQALARRYRVVYSVRPATATTPYEVTHSSAVYAFDRGGRARLLMVPLDVPTPDVDGAAADLTQLIDGTRTGLFERLLDLI